MHFKFAPYVTLVAFLFVSCQKSEPHTTQSEYFNSLLSSAPIHVVDIDVSPSDTIFFNEDLSFCIEGLLGDQGVRSLGDMHLFDDTLQIISDTNNSILWAVNTSGQATQIAGRGDGPGEVLMPLSIDSLQDTLFISDTRFIHAFDQDLKFMYRFPQRSYASPLSKILVNKSLYLSEASVNEPGAKFKVYDRSKDSLVMKRSIFDLVINPETAVKYRLSFNSVISSLSKYDNTLLFYYYSSPYVFLSDENGTISDILRLESAELLAAEPTYSEVDYLHVDQTNYGQADLVPDPGKMGKFTTKITDFHLLENGDIQFIYKSGYLITLTYVDGEYKLANKRVFSYAQNKEVDIYLYNIFQRKNGTYTGFTRPGSCIVNS